jgi:pimeloyl-ACP methyl ester carboxylesterase
LETMIRWCALILLTFILLLPAFGCGDDDDDDDDSSSTPDDDDDSADDDDDNNDDDDDDDTVAGDVIVEWVVVDGTNAPPNPVTGDDTPTEIEKVPFYRMRIDTGNNPPKAVKAILVMMAGAAAGPTDFLALGRDLIEMSDGDLEIWAPDRRGHWLEDQRGLDAAEAAKDPYIAYDYYFNGSQVGGETFQGYYDATAPETSFGSEWGINVMMSDIRSVIRAIPEANRTTNVFIGGHSVGCYIAQAFAAYEFPDGHLGAEEIAGVILVDRGKLNVWDWTEGEYLDAVDDIRTGSIDRFGSWGDLGALVLIEINAMAATEGYGDPGDPTTGPDGHWEDWGGFGGLSPLLFRFHNVTLTNEAMIGFIFDAETGLAGGWKSRVGALGGGTVGHDLIGVFPNEDGADYHWVAFDETQPAEMADLQDVIGLIYKGESDFADWYYPNRYLYEHRIFTDLETTGNWKHDYLKFYNSQMDVPVLALEGQIMKGTTVYEDYRAALAPVRGQALPRDQVGFTIHQEHDWSHAEVLFIAPDSNPFYPELLDFVDEWSTGTVQVPKF